MTEPAWLNKRQESLAATGSGLGLPVDVRDAARRRVSVLALLVLLASSVDLAQLLVRIPFEGASLEPVPVSGNIATAIAALLVIAIGRRSDVGYRGLLDVSTVFEVVLCLILSLSNELDFYESTGVLPNVTWVTPLIIVFPLILPCPPRRTLVAAIAAAATAPLSLVFLDAIGRVPADATALAQVSFSPAIAVAFAYFGSRVVYGMGLDVARARRMGSYELERRLGEGGMGEVWLAHHQMLARPAALKLIRPEVLGRPGSGHDEEVLHRFTREARATAALHSPHTIELFDFGIADDGTFYYAMELLDGLDLASLVERYGPVPPERAVSLLRQACHSLGEAHAAGLIHRDVKPANLYACRLGRDVDFVKVLDFGLVTDPGDAYEHGLTAQGIVHGTPAFMAPEQAARPDQVDARSDLYALGCVAYWLITGHLVFEAHSAVDMLVKHAGTEPIAPSSRSELAVPEALDALILACLAKDPADRPQSADELSDRLAACGVASWSDAEARQWWDDHRPAP